MGCMGLTGGAWEDFFGYCNSYSKFPCKTIYYDAEGEYCVLLTTKTNSPDGNTLLTFLYISTVKMNISLQLNISI